VINLKPENNKDDCSTKILLNGCLYLVNINKFTTDQLKRYLYRTKTNIVIEHNLTLQSSKATKTVSINSLDKLEFISIVGGG
jgi:hypothetical protein